MWPHQLNLYCLTFTGDGNILKAKVQQYRTDRKFSVMEVEYLQYLLNNVMRGHNEVWFLRRVLAGFKQL